MSVRKEEVIVIMYFMKEKSNTSLYKDYELKFPKHKDAEIGAYVSYAIGNDISKKMQLTIRRMTKMIIREFSKEIN